MVLIASENNWREILKTNFTDWNRLTDFLELDPSQKGQILERPKFILNLPLRLAKKIQKKSLDDPILRQFLPHIEETVQAPGFSIDPVGDGAARCGPKLLRKYPGRVLLVCTSACAMHCRYCFRQNFDYETDDKTFSKELAIISGDSSIREVILSGGDPLSLSEKILSPLLKKISRISHVNRIRFHTRFPIGIPERIDTEFLNVVEEISKQIWFVIHCNHPNELDQEILSALRKLQRQRVVVANQAVLLRGVNDRIDTLQTLCELLVDNGVLPYYLHQLDRVQGASRFEVSEEKGKELIKQLGERLPGYAVPMYVREIAGAIGKTPII